MSETFDDALAQLHTWPVPIAAAAVVGPSGVLATYGPQDERLPLASVTKPLAALAVLIAVEEEAVCLDDPADASLLPGATLRHLLAHASGLAPERMLRSFAPAQRRVYSNVGFELAAALVERGTGMAFGEYLAAAVCEPLGLPDTVVDGSPARDGVSSAGDLARVLHELLTPTGLVGAQTRTALAGVQYPGLRGALPGYGGQEHNDWGLGFEIRAAKSPHWTGSANSPRTFGHFGQSGTMLWLDPDASFGAGLGLVALTDRPFGEWAIEAWPRLSDAVLAAGTTAV